MPFRHRKLRVYLEAVDWTIRVHELTRRLPWDWRHLGDQARRAAASTPLNIAEGVAFMGAEQRRHLRIARSSAAECESIFFILTRAGVLPPEHCREAEKKTGDLSAMLTALITHSERAEQRRKREKDVKRLKMKEKTPRTRTAEGQ